MQILRVSEPEQHAYGQDGGVGSQCSNQHLEAISTKKHLFAHCSEEQYHRDENDATPMNMPFRDALQVGGAENHRTDQNDQAGAQAAQ
jgi:hypothetical protein